MFQEAGRIKTRPTKVACSWTRPLEYARGRVFGFSELAGCQRDSLPTLQARQFRKTEHPTPAPATPENPA